MEQIGFVGLGAMGTAMAQNVHKGGFPLQVYNRSPAATVQFREHGVPVCASPRELAGRTDIVVIMVTDPPALQAVLEGPEGVIAGLGPGKLVINMSTVSPEATLAAAEQVCAAGAAFVDAPVSGTVKPAQEGNLVVVVGAEPPDLERARPVLDTIGRQVIHCGPVGQGTRMKLVLNLLLGNLIQTLAEALMLGTAFELPAQTMLEAIGGGPLAAPLFQVKGKAMLERNFSSQFPVRLMFKDLNLLLEAAGKAGVPLPQSAAVRECFTAAQAKGFGNLDMAAVVRVLEELTGRTLQQ